MEPETFSKKNKNLMIVEQREQRHVSEVRVKMEIFGISWTSLTCVKPLVVVEH